MAEQAISDEKSDGSKQKVVICGGGNAAHVFFGLSARDKNSECFLFSLFKTEAQDFKDSVMKNNNKLILEMTQTKTNMEVDINSSNITKDPTCLANADVIIISLPAFAHAQYLKAVAANVGDKACLIGMFPGASGLECDWQHIIMNEKSCKFGNKYTLLSCITLPWACRLLNFGQNVEILGTKASCRVSVYPKYDKKFVEPFTKIIGELPELIDYGHVINMSLGATNAIIHPSILYEKWNKWDGKPLKEKPLFYQGITKEAADLLTKLSEETIIISECIKKESGITTLKTRKIYDAYKLSYGDKCKDTSSLFSIIKTNPAYDGLVHPMIEYKPEKKDDDQKDDDKGSGYVPNFKYRYLTEDIPYGLVVIKGIALLLKDIPDTPIIDMVIQWAQKVMGKQYLIYSNDEVTAGKDINETRAPQKYNFQNIQQLL